MIIFIMLKGEGTYRKFYVNTVLNYGVKMRREIVKFRAFIDWLAIKKIGT